MRPIASLIAEKRIKKRIPIIVSLIVLTLAALSAWALRKNELQVAQSAIETRLRVLNSAIELFLEERFQAVQRMANRLQTDASLSKWKRDSQDYLATFEEIEALVWLSPSENILGFSSRPSESKDAKWLKMEKIQKTLRLSKEEQSYSISPVIPIEPFGLSVVLSAPIFHRQEFKGFILSVFDLNKLLSRPLLVKKEKNIIFELFENQKKIFSSGESHQKIHAAVQSTLFEPNYTLHAWGKDKFLDQFLSSSPWVVLFGGFLLSLLSAFTLRLFALSQEGENKFALAVSNAPYAILMVNRKGQIVLLNREFSSVFGYSEDEALKMNVDELVPERFRASHPENRGRFLRDPRSRPMGQGRNLFGLRKDGQEIPIEIGLTPVETHEGVFVMASIVDISARKAAETQNEKIMEELEKSRLEAIDTLGDLRKTHVELETQRTFIRQVINNADAVIYVKDADGKYLLVNSLYEKLFDVKEHEISGKTDFDIFPSEAAAEFRKADSEVWKTQKGKSLEENVPHLDQTVHTYLSTKFPIFDSTGKIYAVAGISTDITPIKKVESELKQSNQELSQFAYVASHDLQAPLRHVTSYTQLIAEKHEKGLDDESKKWMEYVVNGVGTMRTLISDLLAYSRVGRGRNLLEVVNVQEILTEIVEILAPQMKEKNASVTFDNLPTIKGSRTQLRQLFQNLLENALKFSKKGVSPKIEISFLERQGSYEFQVKDNGIGIPDEGKDKIFHVFQRLHQKGEYSGTGIGLSICKKIVELHGGEIWVNSKPREGTTFHFTLLGER